MAYMVAVDPAVMGPTVDTRASGALAVHAGVCRVLSPARPEKPIESADNGWVGYHSDLYTHAATYMYIHTVTSRE